MKQIFIFFNIYCSDPLMFYEKVIPEVTNKRRFWKNKPIASRYIDYDLFMTTKKLTCSGVFDLFLFFWDFLTSDFTNFWFRITAYTIKAPAKCFLWVFQNVLEIQMGDIFAETKLLKQFPLLPNTNRMQASIHISMAVRPSAWKRVILLTKFWKQGNTLIYAYDLVQ